MAKRDRITLKKFFVRGKMPTEEHFSDLIESTLNIVDEGFDKSVDKGLSLAPLDEEGHIASIFRKIEDEESKWSITLDNTSEDLTFRQFDRNELLTLSQKGRVGIGTINPRFQLHTSKTAGLYGRAGTYASGEVPADSQWHDITEKLYGCFALEVIAGCGLLQQGKYALIVATAIQCFGAHRRIHRTQSWYGSRFNKIRLRWKSVDGKAVLQIKTRYDYGPGVSDLPENEE